MKAQTTTRARTIPEPSAIHATLTVDDRDALDTLRYGIEWRAILVLRTLATRDVDEDGLDDRDRATLEAGLIELCASIVANAAELRKILNVAEKRSAGVQ